MEISMREFKTHLSKYVGQAQAGLSIELTSHRKIVARLVGVPVAENTSVARLLAAGVASWQGGKPSGAALVLKSDGKLMSEMVQEDRG